MSHRESPGVAGGCRDPVEAVCPGQRGWDEFLDGEVEVIGHHRLGDYPESENGLKLSHEDHEMFPFLVSQMNCRSTTRDRQWW